MKKIFFGFVLSCSALNVLAQSPTGMIAHWDMNGTTNDISGNGHNGTPHLVTTDTGMAGIANTAYSFNGEGSYISVPYSPGFNVNSFSILAVVKVKRFFLDDTIVCNNNPLFTRGKIGADGGYGLSFEDTIGCGIVIDTTHEIFIGTASYSLAPLSLTERYYAPQMVGNVWYRVAETFNDTAYKTYINGVLVATAYVTAPGTPMGVSTDSIAIGYDPYDAEVGYPYSFIGLIDDMQLFNRALTDSEAIHYTDPAILGVANIIANDQVSIFPNPVVNSCSILLPEHAGNATVYVINELGQTAYEKTVSGNNAQLDLGNLPTGVYITRIKIAGQSIFKKILVAHK